MILVCRALCHFANSASSPRIFCGGCSLMIFSNLVLRRLTSCLCEIILSSLLPATSSAGASTKPLFNRSALISTLAISTCWSLCPSNSLTLRSIFLTSRLLALSDKFGSWETISRSALKLLICLCRSVVRRATSSPMAE